MSEPDESAASGTGQLLTTPALVIRYLRKEPLLLVGFGAAVILAIIAIFAPGDKSVYAWPVAGLVLAVCLIWTLAGVLRARADGRAADAGWVGGAVVTTERADVEGVSIETEGSTRGTVTASDRSRVRDVRIASRQLAAVAPPAPSPAVDDVELPLAEEPPAAVATAGPRPPASTGERDLFVGRQAEIDEVLTLVGSPHQGTVIDVVGVRGVGKSALLGQLVVEVRRQGGVLTRAADMVEFVDGYRDDVGTRASLAVLEHTLAQSRRLMHEWADDLGGAFDAVWNLFEANRHAFSLVVNQSINVSGNARASQLDLDGDFSVAITEEQLKQKVREAQADVDDAFVDAWTRYTRPGRRMLIAIDSFERCADDELGRWIVRMGLRLPNVTMVLARMPGDDDLPVQSERLRHRWLANFSPAEVGTYFKRRTLGVDVAPDIVEVVHEFTEGHPGGVILVGELFNERGPETTTSRELRRTLARLPSVPQEAWASLVDEILTSVRGRDAVRAAAVVSSFDQSMLAALLGAGQGGEANLHDASRAIGELTAYRLLTPVLTTSGQPTDRWRMHEFIRQSVGQRLRSSDGHTWLAMHASAAAHYFQAMQACEDGREGSYGSWYKYEHVDWQRYKREWLYHAGQLGHRRTQTRAQFAQVFLEAFWWWGCYLDFDFNRHLLDDWDWATAAWAPPPGPDAGEAERKRDEEFGDALRFILTHYPKGHLKPATAPWAEIAEQLRLLRRLCGIDRARQEQTEEHAEAAAVTDAFINVFLAHTCRFVDPADERTDRYYDRARAAFEEMDDGWTVAWIDLERADVALDRRAYDEIAPLLARSAARVLEFGRDDEESWDHELMANLHRVHADQLWQQGDLAGAGRAYARAVTDAYWFQGFPHPADLYTQKFYLEITQRAALRVQELSARNDEAAFVEFLSGFGTLPAAPSTVDSAALREGRLMDILAALFPAGPADDDLDKDDTSFMRRWDLAREDAVDPADSLAPLIALAGEPPAAEPVTPPAAGPAPAG